ncbi:unnamed protein product [Polarella glacialis]|uniref:Uncharacterized protein n=1 Tax=Polarella glacialis TaxID=89957 RepID=A0A813LVH3_POLGL|nr:unnamed protein product [Polarella glacialis]
MAVGCQKSRRSGALLAVGGFGGLALAEFFQAGFGFTAPGGQQQFARRPSAAGDTRVAAAATMSAASSAPTSQQHGSELRGVSASLSSNNSHDNSGAAGCAAALAVVRSRRLRSWCRGRRGQQLASPAAKEGEDSVVRSVSAQVIAALAVVALPFASQADDILAMPALPPTQQQQQQPQQQQQQPQQQHQQQQEQQSQPVEVSGRVTYSKLLEFVNEGSVSRVDFYDLGRTAVVTVTWLRLGLLCVRVVLLNIVLK